MSDPLVTHEVPAADTLAGRDRDARVEQLLLAGLDQYFAGQYDQAVYVWTRVLFLDRGHARARAYIERARSALAERQRECDELLHRGTAAFEQGQSDAARSLLTAAMDGGATADVALSYLGRLDRLGPFSHAGGDVTAAHVSPRFADQRPEPQRRHVLAASIVASIALALIGAGAWWLRTTGSLDLWHPAAVRTAAITTTPADPIIVPQATDRVMARARQLFATGHVRDALQLLGTIPTADPNRADADRLLAEIQRTLLSASGAEPEAMSTIR
jgi:hypothetical protein